MKNFEQPPEIIDIVRQYVNNEVDERVAYDISQDPDDKTSINQLKNFYCKEIVADLLHEELECPIKIAEKYFGKVNENTIKKAFQNIDWFYYNKTADLLAVDKVNAYMNSKCKYCNIGYDSINKLSTSIVVNIYKTLGLSKEIFLNYINSCFYDCSKINANEAEAIWEHGQNISNGTICQHCFSLSCSPF